MGFWKNLRVVLAHPDIVGELETARNELRQTQQTMEQSERQHGDLWLTLQEQQDCTRFLSHKAEALQDALEEFCPRLSAPEDMKRFYDAISPSLDAGGFTLNRMARELTGINVPSCFPCEDNRGLFEEMDGHQLLHWLTAAHFQAVAWTPIPGSSYESATLGEVDTSAPAYQAFEKQLYEKVLERMGFGEVLAPAKERQRQEHQKNEKKRGEAR